MPNTMLSRATFLLAITLFFPACHHSTVLPSGELAKSVSHIKINLTQAEKVPIPTGNGLTIVNLFDDFSTGCPTGNRFETIEHLHSAQPLGARILLVFSDKHFSTQDVENFKAILPMSESMVQGDIETVRPQLIYGKLLVVLDAKGNLIWQEKSGMSEQQVLSEVSQLIHTDT